MTCLLSYLLFNPFPFTSTTYSQKPNNIQLNINISSSTSQHQQQLQLYSLFMIGFQQHTTSYYFQLLKIWKKWKTSVLQYFVLLPSNGAITRNVFDSCVYSKYSFWVRLGFSCEFSIWLASCCSLVIGQVASNSLYRCSRGFQPIRGSQLMNYR